MEAAQLREGTVELEEEEVVPAAVVALPEEDAPVVAVGVPAVVAPVAAAAEEVCKLF